VDGLRINPGNIGGARKLEKVVFRCRERQIPIRIGVNAGSLEKEVLKRYGGPTPEALVASALKHIRLLEDLDFTLIKVSLKSSGVWTTVKAYELLAAQVPYPLHLGVTEAGPLIPGTVKSALGIGLLLAKGIGDTIRVSLTRPPTEEVRVAYEILRALGLRNRGVEIISCPTCGRCQVDLLKLVHQAEKRLISYVEPLKVAIMGCVVNGPGEARHADLGIAGGKGQGVLFKEGRVLRKIPEKDLLSVLLAEIENLRAHRRRE
jgi:(E)-4-hydroxy-3-methylbut-2-enyl-diphosphate synthase